MKLKRTMSGILAAVTVALGTVSTVGTANAFEIETNDMPTASAAAAEKAASGDEIVNSAQYGLCDNVKNGVILHAWCWSFNTIKENMKLIAESGYTAVQTSPANMCASDVNGNKVLMGLENNAENGNLGAWYWHYQPIEWSVGNYQLGSENEYKEMCAEAKKYGVKIITDVLPNHTASDTSKVTQNFITAVGGYDKLYHGNAFNKDGNIQETIDHDSRTQSTTYSQGGLPDVNTENPLFQAYFVEYCNKLIELGCDGFRLDTAKHIGIASTDPLDPKTAAAGWTNDFFEVFPGQKEVTDIEGNVVKFNDGNKDLYIYGEILEGSAKIPYSDYAKYMDLTASTYGYKIRNAIKNLDFSTSTVNLTNFSHAALTADKLVTWVESHDTYCNNHTESGWMTDWQIRMAWAAITARNKGTPLFYNRPAGSNGSAGNYWGNNEIGPTGNEQFYDKEVVAVNKFRNAMVGESETLRNITANGYSNKILQIDRGTKGTCIINLGSAATINSPTTMADGTYKDTVSGKTFRVKDGYISGELNAQSIATIYSPVMVSASPKGTAFTEESIDVTLAVVGAVNDTGTYEITVDGEPASSGSFTNGDKLTLGKDLDAVNTSRRIVLTLTAVDENNTTVTSTYVYKKRDANYYNYLYFDNSSANWSNVYAYIYTDSGLSNASWPGKLMTYDSATKYYKYKLPVDLEDGYVIFAESKSSSNRYPADQQPGVQLGGKTQLFDYSTKKLVDYTPPAQNDSDTDTSTDTANSGDTYTYFFNYTNWDSNNIYAYLWQESNNSNKNAKFPGELMSWSDALHCYYYKYNPSDGYDKVIFSTDDSTVSLKQTKDADLKVGEIFVPTNKITVNNSDVIDGSWVDPSAIKTNKIYFNNTDNWSVVNAYMYYNTNNDTKKRTFYNKAWPGEPMTYCGSVDGLGDNLYCYTYYYPEVEGFDDCYNDVIFRGSVSSEKKENLGYTNKSTPQVYNNGSWKDVGTISEISIPVELKYFDRRVGESGSANTEFEEVERTNTVTVKTTDTNIDNAVGEAIDNFKMSNLYDDYTFGASQFDNIKNIACEEISENIPYFAKINPDLFAYQTTAFSGTYNDYVSELDKAVQNNRKWVTYYSKDGTKLSIDAISPDLSNVGKVEVWGFNLSIKYNVEFKYPKTQSEFENLKSVNSAYTSKEFTGSVLKTCSYNQLLVDENNKDLTSDMYIPNDYVFDGWYIVNFNNDNSVQSYVKVSSEKDYKYRITSNLELYAAFKKKDSQQTTELTPGASVLTSGKDTFIGDNNEVNYRFNTMLNIYNCYDNDSKITDVGVIYIKLDSSDTSYSFDKSKLDTIIGDSSKNGELEASDKNVKYNYYHYNVTKDGKNGTAKLTAKNRVQFILNVKESLVTEKYSNVAVYTAFKRDGIWYVSDNCIIYKNGTPQQQYIQNKYFEN